MIIYRLAPIAALLLTGACDSLTPSQAVDTGPVARLPEQVCQQAREGIAKLTESGGFTYAGNGEGTMDEAAWLQLDGAARDQLTQILAFDAACAAKDPPAEQTATVRNEGGRVLAQRIVETRADLPGAVDQ